jgi:hypothetical protein
MNDGFRAYTPFGILGSNSLYFYLLFYYFYLLTFGEIFQFDGFVFVKLGNCYLSFYIIFEFNIFYFQL